LCVERKGWLSTAHFEDAIATCNLLPGPASTQLAIFSAWSVAGPAGAIVGGLAFITPGLVLILGLSALFLAASPPAWVLGAGAGAGAAVAAVAVQAGSRLVPASWARARTHWRWVLYAAAGLISAATIGPWLVIVLLACGGLEVAARRGELHTHAWPFLIVVAVTATGGLGALAWVAFKVGALSYGGGFVIVPLMQHDAVHSYHWMTNSQFLDGVALGQVTPGPVVLTVGVVGYAAAGIAGALLAVGIAFTPSFFFVLTGAPHFDRLRDSPVARAFLDGAGPAAIGAILGVAIPLTLALGQAWQYAVLASSALALFVLRRSVVTTLLAAGAIGIIATHFGAPLP
jgi:chromate transporter